MALSFSARWIKLAVDFDYLEQLTQQSTITYLLLLYGVFHTPFFPGPLLQLITIIKSVTVSVEAHYTMLGNTPTDRILRAKGTMQRRVSKLF